jgi:hypothetical protein
MKNKDYLDDKLVIKAYIHAEAKALASLRFNQVGKVREKYTLTHAELQNLVKGSACDGARATLEMLEDEQYKI